MKNINKFLSQNPNFNLATDNLARNSVQEKLNWEKLNKAKVLPQVQTYQRLYRLHPDGKVVWQVMKSGFHSAHQIAAKSESQFVAAVNENLKGNTTLAKEIWQNSRSLVYQVNQLVMGIKPEPNGTAVAKKSATPATESASEPMMKVAGTTDFETDLPSYNQLFGPQYACQCAECKSIWGPAAYFTDLMTLIQTYITDINQTDDTPPVSTIPPGLSLEERRPDLWTMELNCENTNKEMPYLKIANEVMSTKLQTDLGLSSVDDLEKYIAINVYPFDLPMNLPEAKISDDLEHFGISLADTFGYLLVEKIDIARAVLNISTNQLSLLTNVATDLDTAYGLYTSEDNTDNAFIAQTNNFLNKTGLTAIDLSALFFQNCLAPSISNNNGTGTANYSSEQAKLYHQFFINQLETNIDATTQIDADDAFLRPLEYHIDSTDFSSSTSEIVVAIPGNQNNGVPSSGTFDRLQRFIRLAKKLDWTFADLDWALTALGADNIDDSAIEDLAGIQSIMDQLGIPVDETVALFSSVKTIGPGNGIVSQTLFDRTFNQPNNFNGAAEPYHPIYDNNPLFTNTILTCNFTASLNTSSTPDSAIKSNVLAALQVSEADFSVLLDFIINNSLWISPTTTELASQIAGTTYLTVENLSLLYRWSRLPQLLNIPFAQFFDLLPNLPDLGSGYISNVSDLTKVLSYFKQIKESLLSIGQVNYLLHPNAELPLPVQAKMNRQMQMMQQQMQQSAGAVLLNSKSFVSSTFNDNQAAQLFANLVAQDYINEEGVVLDIRPLIIDNEVTIEPDTAKEIKNILDRYKAKQDKLVLSSMAGLYQLPTATMEAGMHLTQRQLAAVPTFDSTQQGGVNIPYDAALNPNAFTIMFWLKATNTSNEVQYLYYSFNNPQGFYLKIVNGILECDINNINKEIHINFGEWIHVMISVDSGGSMATYINGVLNTSYEYGPYTPNDSVDTTIAGILNRSESLDGTMADIRLYNTVLPQEEAYLSMNSLRPDIRWLDNLCAWWPMTFGASNTFYDWSGNGHDGTFNATDNLPVCPHYNPRLMLIGAQAQGGNNTALYEYNMLLPRNLSWLQWNQLKSAEGLAIAKNPQPFGQSNMRYDYHPDYEDLMILSTYKKQCADFGVTGIEYLTYLDQTADVGDTDKASTTKQNTLANLTGWDVNQLSFLIDSFQGLTSYPDFNQVSGLSVLNNCFKVSQTMGVDTSVVWHLRSIRNLQVTDNDSWTTYTDVASEYNNALVSHYSAEELQTAVASMKGAMEEQTRDFLCNLLIWELGATLNGIDSQDQLYEYLLLDVEMTSVVNISTLKLGLNSLQLYVQRCMMNLENSIDCTIPKDWWNWMGDYREWQTNREVYLYPENYVDPTLRKIQSPLFNDLVNTVKQSPISRETVTNAYSTYLNGLKEIAHLHIVDSSVFEVPNFSGSNTSGDKKMICVFGRTMSDPTTYFYRQALVPSGSDAADITENSLAWAPWQQIPLNIPADYVTSVFAFNRLFIFWVTQQQASSNVSGQTYPYISATIYYAYQEVGEGWSAPQTLQSDVIISVMGSNNKTLYYQPGVDYYTEQQWLKVQAWAVKTSDGQQVDSSIYITLGDTVSNFPYSPPSPSSSIITQEQDEFNQRLIQVETNSSHIGSRYTTIITGFLLNAGLRVTEVDPCFDMANTDFFDGQISLVDSSTQVHAELKNDFIQPNVAPTTATGPFISLDQTKPSYYHDIKDKLNIANYNAVSYDGVSIYGQNTNAWYFNGGNYFYISSPPSGVSVLPDTFLFSCTFLYYGNDEYTLFSNNDGSGNGLKLYFHGDNNTLKFKVFDSGNGSDDYDLHDTDDDTWYSLSVKIENSKATYTLINLYSGVTLASNTVVYFDGKTYSPPSNGIFGLGVHLDNYDYILNGYIKDPVFKQLDSDDTMIAFISSLAPGFLDTDSSVASTNNYVLAETVKVNGVEKSALAFDGTSSHYHLNGSATAEILPATFSFSCSFLFFPQADEGYRTIFNSRVESDGSTGEGLALYNYNAADGTYTLEIHYYQDNNTTPQSLATNLEENTWYTISLIVTEDTTTVFLQNLKTSEILLNNQAYAQTYTPSSNGKFYLGVGEESGSAALFWKGYLIAPIFHNDPPGLDVIPAISTLSVVNNQRSWYTLNTKQDSFLAIPKSDVQLTKNVLAFAYNNYGMLEISYKTAIGDTSTALMYQYIRLSTNVVEQMLEDVFAGGLQKLLKPSTQYLGEPVFNQYMPVGVLSPSSLMDFSGAYGNYFWELFYHIPMYLARSLQTEQQFSEAMQWYDVIFDPMLSSEELTSIANNTGQPQPTGNEAMRAYLLFRPFQTPDIQSIYDVLTNEPNQILLYEYDPFDPNAIAALRTSAYAKATVMQYIANLIAYGDYLFTEDSWESINSATMYYTTAQRLLGKAPAEMPPETGRMDKTYADFETDSTTGNVPMFLVDVEVEIPTTIPTYTDNSELNELIAQRLSLMSNYFCVPSNGQLSTYRQTIDDRLYKIRNGLNISGQTNDIPLFQPPINPATAVQDAANGAGSASSMAGNIPVPYYRFSYLINAAKNLTAQVTQFGGSLLSALEKNDAEALSLLRETQSNAILMMTTQLKEDQINQLYTQQSNLQANLDNAQLQQSIYQQWIDDSWNGYEIAQFSTNGAAIALNQVAQVATMAGAAMFLWPNIFGTSDGGINWGGFAQGVSSSISEEAGILSQSAGLLATKGAFERTNDNWDLQEQLATNSIAGIQAQLKGIQYQIDSAEQDYNINQTQISQSNDVISFLQTKFTNEELYQWLSGQISTIYFQAYQVAFNLATMAQTAFQYEFSSSQSFISNSGWNDLYKGLMAGETLSQNLQQLEQAYIQGNNRSLEIEKTISLLQLDPGALINLKMNGTCQFSLDEKLFDLDFPGHYKRKITSIAITIPAIVGPYQNVHATLTQTSNTVLAEANVAAVSQALGIPTSGASGVYQNWNSNQEIAISTGNNDSGMFQLNFNDERYLFFEGTGAISSWQLDMPKASNQFNFNSISDVIINLKYTAYDGGADFRNQVLAIQGNSNNYILSDYSGTKYISMRQYYGLAWQQFLNTGSTEITLTRAMFVPNVNGLTILDTGVLLTPVLQDSSTPLVTQTSSSADGNLDNGPITLTINTDPSNIANPDLWDDLLIQIPYTGSLDWGDTDS